MTRFLMQSVIVSGSRDFTIRLWDARVGGESLSSLEGHRGEVSTVQWHGNGHFILSAGRDNQAKVTCNAFSFFTAFAVLFTVSWPS